MHKHILFLLIGILLLGSCSIEKRLYNRGWHVEFHRKNKTEKSHLSEKNSTISDSLTETHLLAESSKQVFESELERTVHTIQPKESVRHLQTVNQDWNAVQRTSEEKNVTQYVKTEKSPTLREKTNPSSWSKSGKRTSVIGVTILFVLVLILFFSLLFIISTSGDIAALFVLGLFAVIIGIIGLILFFLLLTMLLVKSQERIDEKATEKEIEREAVEKMPSEEKEKYLKDQKTKDREGKIAAGFVVIVLLLILGVALL